MTNEVRVRLDEALFEQLSLLAAKPGASKSAIIQDAVRAYLDGKASRELDERLRMRLDVIAAQLNRMERNQTIQLEGFALYVKYELVATASVSEDDRAARAIGHQRFQSYVAQLGRTLAQAKSFGDEVQAHAAAHRGSQ